MKNNKISVTFECDDADMVGYLCLVYELLHQYYEPKYAPSFSVRNLPDFLDHLADVVTEGLDEKVWCVNEAILDFSDEEYDTICTRLGIGNRRWIKTAERLPARGVFVLWYVPNGHYMENVMIGKLMQESELDDENHPGERNTVWGKEDLTEQLDNCIYWMPLPLLPNGDQAGYRWTYPYESQSNTSTAAVPPYPVPPPNA